MKKVTGIYRITNLNNNKRYIGQSRNIFSRWKQHTYKLKDAEIYGQSLIRKAFIKYGLKTQVSSFGEYHGFRFEIIEECDPEILLEREYHYIAIEKPEYNLALMPPNPDYIFKSRNIKHHQFWIQYHNTDKNLSYPGHTLDFPLENFRRDLGKTLDDFQQKGEDVDTQTAQLMAEYEILAKSAQKQTMEFLDAYEIPQVRRAPFSFIGYIKVREIREYETEQQFREDEANHGSQESLAQVKDALDCTTLWGIEIEEILYLEEPIQGIIPPMDTFHPTLWISEDTAVLKNLSLLLEIE